MYILLYINLTIYYQKYQMSQICRIFSLVILTQILVFQNV